jgi:hypothetical protein
VGSSGSVNSTSIRPVIGQFNKSSTFELRPTALRMTAVKVIIESALTGA